MLLITPRLSLTAVVQVIMATNRADTLDPALLRPGRLDRKIEFPLPSRREKRLIFQTITSKMNLGPDVDLEDCRLSACSIRFGGLLSVIDVSRPDKLASAQIASICQAAGLQGESFQSTKMTLVNPTAHPPAVRKNRYVVLPIDFEEAWKVCFGVVLYL
jgi:26S proteasome regulatory subunit T3